MTEKILRVYVAASSETSRLPRAARMIRRLEALGCQVHDWPAQIEAHGGKPDHELNDDVPRNAALSNLRAVTLAELLIVLTHAPDQVRAVDYALPVPAIPKTGPGALFELGAMLASRSADPLGRPAPGPRAVRDARRRRADRRSRRRRRPRRRLGRGLPPRAALAVISDEHRAHLLREVDREVEHRRAKPSRGSTYAPTTKVRIVVGGRAYVSEAASLRDALRALADKVPRGVP